MLVQIGSIKHFNLQVQVQVMSCPENREPVGYVTCSSQNATLPQGQLGALHLDFSRLGGVLAAIASADASLNFLVGCGQPSGNDHLTLTSSSITLLFLLHFLDTATCIINLQHQSVLHLCLSNHFVLGLPSNQH